MASHSRSRFSYTVGAGVNVYFRDNPKDREDYKACLGLRFPLGFDVRLSDALAIGLQWNPFVQLLPPFVFKPYGLDLNGGLVIRF